MKRGSKHTQQSKNKIRNSLLGNENAKGKSKSYETKQKISNSLKGKKKSEQTRRRMSKAKKERRYE